MHRIATPQAAPIPTGASVGLGMGLGSSTAASYHAAASAAAPTAALASGGRGALKLTTRRSHRPLSGPHAGKGVSRRRLHRRRAHAVMLPAWCVC
jgi:hypothetical protein